MTKKHLSGFEKAARQGDAEGQFQLGRCYLEGDGVSQNRSEAKRLFQKAAELGHEDAKKALQYIEQQSDQNSSYTNNLSADESTIIERNYKRDEGNTSHTNSDMTLGSTSTTQENNNSTIGWIVGIAIAIIIGYVVYSNQDKPTLDSSNPPESNSSITTQHNQTSSQSPIPKTPVTKTKESELVELIANNVEKYPYEIGLKENKEFSRRFSSLIGSSKYSSFKINRVLEHPIKKYDNSGKFGVYFFDKDEQYIYYIIYDKFKDNLTVIMMENGINVSTFSYVQEKPDQYLVDNFNVNVFND